MELDTVTLTINNVFKQLNVACLNDITYKMLLNVGSQYEYIGHDLLEQMIEAELIILLERSS